MENNQKQSAKPNTEDKKSRRDFMLSISNLVLTAIIGIGIAIYLNYRDERIQKDLVSLQAETERQFNLANLQIDSPCLYDTKCLAGISLKNLGLSHAKNVKLVIVLDSVNENWTSSINSIKQFQVKTFSPSLNIISITPIKVDTLRSVPVVDYNAYEVLIENIPSHDEVKILLERGQAVQIENHAMSIAMTTNLIDEPTSQSVSNFDPLIRRCLESIFDIAKFSVSASCENCEGNTDKPTIAVSALETQEIIYKDIYRDSGLTGGSTNFHQNLAIKVNIQSPKDITFNSDNFSLNLANKCYYNNAEFIFQSITP